MKISLQNKVILLLIFALSIFTFAGCIGCNNDTEKKSGSMFHYRHHYANHLSLFKYYVN